MNYIGYVTTPVQMVTAIITTAATTGLEHTMKQTHFDHSLAREMCFETFSPILGKPQGVQP